MAANKTNTKDFSKVYETVTDQIIKEMEKGIIPWKKGWTAISGAYNAKSKRYYSFLNQMILAKPGAWASFKQWQELGAKIKKGEHAEYVMEWFSKKIEWTATNEETGEEEKKSYLRWYPRTYPVFHESQVEGWTAPQIETIKPAEPIEAAEELVNNYKGFSGIKDIITDEMSAKAYYSPVMDYIQVPMKEQFDSIEEYYSTLFHEMTHSTGHTSRLDRGLNTKLAAFGSNDYSKEELTAELGAAMIMARLGIDTPETFKNSTAYLQSWLKALKNDKSLLVSAASYAEASTRYIFNEKR